ncbi:unnamed protein product [Dicrocoelium dendriticum]|nr:unnamed protein product [Dicrocoelium dendriticum]
MLFYFVFPMSLNTCVCMIASRCNISFRHILNTPVSEQEFLEHLHELDHKINFSLGQSISEYKSLEDVSTLLKNLKIKAITKIREYLLQKIYSLRRPLTNYQIPQNQLLKYRFYNEFLLAHDRETAREILTEYVNTMSKVYYSYFKAYCAKLNKVQLDTTSEKDILLGKRFEEQGSYGSGSSVISTMSFPTSSSTNSSPSAGAVRVGIFALGDRATRVLSKSGLEAPIILPHVAVKGDVKYPLEVLFRSIQFALLDVACREYFFLSDFFFLSPESPESLSYQAPALQHAPTGGALTALFDQVMGRTLNLLRKQVESNLIPIGSHDALGLLICLQVLHAMLRLARERGVHVMEKFWTSLTETLWVHVTDRLDAHIASLRNDFDVTNFNISARGLVGTMAGGVSGSGLSGRTYPLIRPHAVARRYAELAASLHSIGHGYPGSPLFPDSDDGTLKQKSGEASSSPRSSYGGPSSFPTGSLSGISALRVSVQSSDKSVIKPTLDARILSRLAQLQTQFECVLTRLADSFPTQRLKCVFLINNFDLVLSVLTERGAGDSAEAVRCREAAAKHTTTFINEALTPYFGSLISFVRDFESQQTPNSVLQVGNEPETSAIARNEEARAIRIIKGFNIDWKNSIEKIHSEIMIEFANFTLGTEIYQNTKM